MGALGRVFRVQPGEGRTVGLIVALMFTSSAGLTIGESGITALFFDRVGPDSLPLMYLAQGATGFVAMLVLTGSLGRVDRRRAYVALPMGVGGVVLLERTVLAADPVWIYPVLWVTATLAALVQAVYLWGTAGLVTDTRRAKRLFPLFAAGGILGAVVGGLVTIPLARSIGAENLLLIWAVALASGAVLGAVILGVPKSTKVKLARRGRRSSPVRELAQGLAFVRRSPLVTWMTVAAVLFSVMYFSLYLPFAQEATDRFPDADELAGFFGIFWASVTGVAFVLSIFLTNRLLGWFGAAAVVLVLPILYAGSFGILLASPVFTATVAIRFAVTAWLQGVSSPAWETLVNVVPETRRDQTRAFLNGGPTQAGTAIAGVIALAGPQTLSSRQLGVIGLVVAAITVFVTWRIRRSYSGALVDALKAGRPSVFEGVTLGAPVVIDRDGQALGLALEASRDPDPRIRRLAVEMLAAATDERAHGALAAAIDDDDPLVRSNAVRGVERYGEPLLIERALDDEDSGVRLSAVLASRATSSEPALSTLLTPRLRDADASVAAAAAVALLHGPSGEAADRLHALLLDEDPGVRTAALGQLRLALPEDIAPFALELAKDASPHVRAAALETLAAAGRLGAIRPAIEALADPDPSVRAAALDALAGLDLRGYEAELRGAAEARAARAVEDHALAVSIPANGDASELLRDAVMDRGRRHALVAFSALALLSDDRATMQAAFDNLDTADPGQLANALETLEVTADARLVRPLLGLWEPAPARVEHAGDWLERAVTDDDPFVRSCAELVRATQQQGDAMARSRTSMSPMERVLALRKIPLFAALTPADLNRVAGIAEEQTFADGDVIADEGELGDEMHIVVEGLVRVVRGDAGASAPVARRGPGDVVGEMSIITRTPRVASLVAESDVRTVRIGHREFETMIRERPDVALAVMRVLAERLEAETAR